MITFEYLHPGANADHVGLLPEFLDERDPRPAKEQFHQNYSHGGGWFPIQGFERDPRNNVLRYPGDPPLQPLARMRLRDEIILVYQYGFVAIIQKDGSFAVARMD